MKLLLLLSITVFAASANSQRIDWFAAADFVGVKNQEDQLEQDGYLREFELALYSEIDHNWKGSMSFVYAKDANEEMTTEIHEAFVQSSNVFMGDTLKIGQFFLGVGKLNRTHRHEWSFTTSPFFFSEYFGSEGVMDTGAEYTHRLGTGQNLQITAGLTKGNEFVHEHGHDEEAAEEEKSNAQWPTHYLRVGGFNEIATTTGLEYGVNYLGRKDAEKVTWYYTGADFTFKKRVGKYIDWKVQGEYWVRTYKENKEDEQSDDGAYILIEKGLDQHHSFGLLYGIYNAADKHEEEGHVHEETEGRVVEAEFRETTLQYTYSNSEFMKYRFSAGLESGLLKDEEEVDNYKYQIQMVFNIGKHPIHLF
jgi:hypothetical protein